jgi:hypothetical protein
MARTSRRPQRTRPERHRSHNQHVSSRQASDRDGAPRLGRCGRPDPAASDFSLVLAASRPRSPLAPDRGWQAKYAHVYFTKPHYNTALIVKASFSSVAETTTNLRRTAPEARRRNSNSRITTSADMDQLSDSDYRREFGVDPPNAEKRRRALEHALDIRKFEIEQYWKRAAYFWTFIAATLAAYGAIESGKEVPNREHLSAVVGALGIVFSFGWYCVNSGSKRWQENWENHVDMLEDDVVGPLYKTVVGRPPISGSTASVRMRFKHVLTGPNAFSVTKINQIVSLFVTVLWMPMIYKAVGPIKFGASVDLFSTVVLSLALLTCVLILTYGRSDPIDYRLVAWQRTSGLVSKDGAESTTNETGGRDEANGSKKGIKL